MVGLGRPQSCSEAQGSLQQIAMRRVRELVESLRGGGSGGAAFSGGGLQQEEGEACEQGWMASLLAHRAASLTVLLATAGLACLAFWDFRLAAELVSGLCFPSGHVFLSVSRSLAMQVVKCASTVSACGSYKLQGYLAIAPAQHSDGMALHDLQVLWPWRACMAIIHWIYQNLDERRMSQRRQIAEVALRAAIKSGEQRPPQRARTKPDFRPGPPMFADAYCL